MPRHTRWMRRSALLACLVGLAVIVGGSMAIGAAGDDKGTQDLTGKKTEQHSAAKLPPLPKTSRARVVEPEAGATGAGADDQPAEDPGLEDPGPKPTGPASTGGRKAGGVLAGVDGSSTTRATALSNGVALPPLEAPEEVRQIIEAGNSIARTPYKWGGGHGKWTDTGYDCSGSVSFALAAAGLLSAPLASGPLMSWGQAGKGKWVTIYSNPGHVYLVVAGVRFDTSAPRETGSRWTNTMRSNAGFVARHPPGL